MRLRPSIALNLPPTLCLHCCAMMGVAAKPGVLPSGGDTHLKRSAHWPLQSVRLTPPMRLVCGPERQNMYIHAHPLHPSSPSEPRSRRGLQSTLMVAALSSGWLLQQARFPWVWRCLEAEGDMPEDMADIFPDQSPAAATAQLLAIKSWLASLPLARRPLVKVCAPSPAVPIGVPLNSTAQPSTTQPVERGRLTRWQCDRHWT